MTSDEKLERLIGIVDSLASTVVAHDNPVEALIKRAEQHAVGMANLERQWQAHINTLPRH